MTDITPLVTGRSFLEGPRWHEGALYVSDMHGDVVLRVTESGDVSTVVEVEQPSGLGWLPDGSLLISSMTRRCVMRLDGSDLTVHADVSALAEHEINDMCVDQHGHAFVGQFGYDLRGGGTPAPAALLRVDPDGSAHEVAPDLRMANGMVITADQSTLRSPASTSPPTGR
jgi:sugar lactone lactonase YvrE